MVPVFYQWLFVAVSFLVGTPPANNINKTAVHPFYVSVTEINHNAADKNLEISCKIFTDDLETAINKTFNSRVDLFNPKNKAEADRLIFDYISRHLQIKLDGRLQKLQFVGFERESEAIWSYLQVSNTAAPKKAEISMSLLYESFAEQINLVHMTVNGSRKSTKLNNPDSAVKFDF